MHYMVLIQVDGNRVTSLWQMQPASTKEEACKGVRSFVKQTKEDLIDATEALIEHGVAKINGATLYLAQIPVDHIPEEVR